LTSKGIMRAILSPSHQNDMHEYSDSHVGELWYWNVQ